jgi:hypothetical protein
MIAKVIALAAVVCFVGLFALGLVVFAKQLKDADKPDTDEYDDF